MKAENISARRLCIWALGGAGLLTAAVSGVCFALTKEPAVIGCSALLAFVLLLWGAFIMMEFQRLLTVFTADLCHILDQMINGEEERSVMLNKESQFSRINHRLERFYGILQKIRQQAEKERNELQSLLSDISHQTKTPIANLKMINDTLLTRTLTDEKRTEFLQAAGSQLDKLDFLIQAMVKTSRLETGVITLEKKEVPIVDTLAAALNGILAQAEKKQIQLNVSCPEKLAVSHDSRWTAEALFNIMDNGVKYTDKGGILKIDVEQWEMYVKITITDTGRGIPECEQAAIFKRFYREEAVHSQEGIGIGLFLAREIITLQGGYIKVDSTAGRGSAFSVFLPAR